MRPGEDEMVADTQLIWMSMGGINRSQIVAAAHATKRKTSASAPITAEERLSRSGEQVNEVDGDMSTGQLDNNAPKIGETPHTSHDLATMTGVQVVPAFPQNPLTNRAVWRVRRLGSIMTSIFVTSIDNIGSEIVEGLNSELGRGLVDEAALENDGCGSNDKFTTLLSDGRSTSKTMTYQPDSPAALRAKDAPALRVLYRRLAAHYETVVDERDEADKRLRNERERAQRTLDRKQVRIRELESELRARDRASVPVERSGNEIEQAKSKIAELEKRLDELTGVLADTRSELQVSQDETRRVEDALDRCIKVKEAWRTAGEFRFGFEPKIRHVDSVDVDPLPYLPVEELSGSSLLVGIEDLDSDSLIFPTALLNKPETQTGPKDTSLERVTFGRWDETDNAWIKASLEPIGIALKDLETPVDWKKPNSEIVDKRFMVEYRWETTKKQPYPSIPLQAGAAKGAVFYLRHFDLAPRSLGEGTGGDLYVDGV
ncbi:MAG: hypothetical protein Q9192_005070 [Flavoplaca navasiana]